MPKCKLTCKKIECNKIFTLKLFMISNAAKHILRLHFPLTSTLYTFDVQVYTRKISDTLIQKLRKCLS